jgi:hypothetical protein
VDQALSADRASAGGRHLRRRVAPQLEHELYDPNKTWQPYKKVAADIGVRLGYYPLSFLGLEIEGGVMPTKLRDGSSRALLGAFRGYGLLQLPYRIAPFALAGFGMLATTGSASAATSTRRCTSAAA